MKPKSKAIHITHPDQLSHPKVKRAIHELLHYCRKNLTEPVQIKAGEKVRLKDKTVCTFSFGIRLAKSKKSPDKYVLSIDLDNVASYSKHKAYQLKHYRKPAHRFSQEQLNRYWTLLRNKPATSSKHNTKKTKSLFVIDEKLSISRHRDGNNKVLWIDDKLNKKRYIFSYNTHMLSWERNMDITNKKGNPPNKELVKYLLKQQTYRLYNHKPVKVETGMSLQNQASPRL